MARPAPSAPRPSSVDPLPSLPSLGELAADPSRAVDVPPIAVPGLLVQTAAVQAALAARFVAVPAPSPLPRGGPEGLLAAPEVAKRLGVPLARVYELARTGTLPSVRFGRGVRFDPEALRTWIEQHSTHNGVDTSLASTYSSTRDRYGTAPHPSRPRPHASRASRASRGHAEQHRPPRARRDGHTRTTGTVAAAPRGAASSDQATEPAA